MELDYALEIVKEKKNFSPNEVITKYLNSTHSRIIEINAGNGYGKTFLLNLIAYSLRGTEIKKDTINSTLKERISRYNISNDYLLSFDIKYDLPNGQSLISTKKKGSNEIGTYIKDIDGINDNINLGAPTLHKELTIFYDVPSDPGNRLNGVLDSIFNLNLKLTDSVLQLYTLVNTLSNKCENTKNNNLVFELENERETFITSEESIKLLINKKADQLKQIVKAINILKLQEELRNFETFKIDSDRKYSIFSKIKKPTIEKPKDEKIIIDLGKKLDDLVSSLVEKILGVIKIIESNQIIALLNENPNLKEIYNNFTKINQSKIKSLEQGEAQKLGDDFFKISSGLITIILNIEKNPENQERQQYQTFLEFLDTIEPKILTEVIKINKNEIIKTLQKKINDLQLPADFKSEKKFLNNLGESAKEILAKIFITNRDIIKEKNKVATNPNDTEIYYSSKESFEIASQKLKDCETEITLLKNELKSAGLTDSIISDRQLLSRELGVLSSNSELKALMINKESSRKELLESKKRLEDEKTQIERKRILVELKLENENKKSDELLTTDQKNRLKNIAMSIQAIQLIHRRFSTFFSKREEISELSKMTQNSLFGKSFLQISGNYIAKSMDNKLLKSDGVFESFKYFNIIKKEFELLDGSVIKQDDIATGLASGNYLKQRISNLEGKYLVILLDEIGNMDKKILQEVIESIKKLENEGRLVLALLAKPGNEGITINSY